MKTAHSSLELLETRIAPAGLLIAANGHSATFSDVDGDHVKVAVSKGTLQTADFDLTPMGDGSQFDELNVSDPGFSGASITISVTKDTATHGDGLVAVGEIAAGTNNLGAVSIEGDLGFITAGSGGTTVAVKSLTVASIGRYEAETGTLLTSYLQGTLDSLVIKGDMDGASFIVTQDIGSLSIGGSLIGGDSASDGNIFAGNDLGKVSVKHDVRGGLGNFSGEISAGNDLGAVTIGGSIYGGAGYYSGTVGAHVNVASVTVAGSVIGGAGNNSGDIFAAFSSNGTIGKVTLGGSLVGGGGEDSGIIGGVPAGSVGNNLSLTNVSIGKDIIGGTGTLSGGVFAYASAIGTLTLKGSLIGGSGADFAGFINSAALAGTISIAGSIYGGSGDQSAYLDLEGIDRLIVGGSLFGESGDSSAEIFNQGGTFGLLEIHGDVRGGSGIQSASVIGTPITTTAIGGAVIPGTGAGSGTVA